MNLKLAWQAALGTLKPAAIRVFEVRDRHVVA